MLTIEFGYVRVYIFSVALQAIIERRARETENGNTASPVIAKPGNADDEYLKRITAAARSILRVIVYDIFPDDSFKYIPVRTYSRILAGSLCLLKVSKALAHASRYVYLLLTRF